MREVEAAPFRLDDAVMYSRTGWAAGIKRTRHIGDLTGWNERTAYQKALTRLIRCLRADLK